MFAVIRRYNTQENSAQKIEQRVREGFVPLISQLPGFISYDVVRSADGTLLSVSVFESRDAADASTRLASDWVHQNLASLIRTAPVILSGDVIVHHASTAAASAPRGHVLADRHSEARPPVS
jgi:heme-degrading monooxygenase HmoA